MGVYVCHGSRDWEVGMEGWGETSIIPGARDRRSSQTQSSLNTVVSAEDPLPLAPGELKPPQVKEWTGTKYLSLRAGAAWEGPWDSTCPPVALQDRHFVSEEEGARYRPAV